MDGMEKAKCVVTKQTIESELQMVETAVGDLYSVIDVLAGKLAPVRAVMTVPVEPKQDGNKRVMSPVLNTLEGIKNRLFRLRDAVQLLHGEIEL